MHIIAIALALYGAFMTIEGVLVRDPIILPLVTLAFVPYGALAAWWFVRHPGLDERARWAYPFIFTIALLAVIRDVVEISLTETLDTRSLSLLVIGAAVVILDTRWYSAVIGLVVVAWSSAIVIVPGFPGARRLSIELVSSIVVGLVMHLALSTVHKQRENAVTENKIILDAIGAVGQGYLLTNGRKVLDVNDAYLAMAGRTREELLALDDIMACTPEEDREPLRNRLRERLVGGSVPDQYEGRMIRGDGSLVDVEVSVKLISSSPPLIFSIVRDISERKASEKQVRAAQAMKDKLTAGLSHDLRTPLTAIMGFSELLRRSWTEIDPDQRSFLLDRVTYNARELEDMIDQLLDYSRLEHGWSAIFPRRIDLAQWLKEWLTAKAPMVRDHPVVLDVLANARIDADERALGRIVGNLVGNAAKFSEPGGKITIGARPAADGTWLFVKDEGHGIEADVRERLFEPFSQGADPASSKGVGMGLTVVKRYVELHGGRVAVDSGLRKGTTFSVFLPRRAELKTDQAANIA